MRRFGQGRQLRGTEIAAASRRALLAAIALLVAVIAAWAPAAHAAPGDVTTFAGNGADQATGNGGQATAAGIGKPEGVAWTSAGLLITHNNGHLVRFVNNLGVISTFAGGGGVRPGDGGPATGADLEDTVEGIIRNRNGYVYFSEKHRVRSVSPLGIIDTAVGTGSAGYTGDGGAADRARIDRPHGIAFDLSGGGYIADCNSSVVRRVSFFGIISTVAGTGSAGYTGDGGPATSARLDCPTDVAIDRQGNLYISDSKRNVVRKVTPGGTISTVAGTGNAGYSGDGGPAVSALLRAPHGLAIDGGDRVFVADADNHVIRRIDSSGGITTVAGTGAPGFSGDGGPASSAQLRRPHYLDLDPTTGDLYVSERENHRVRRIQAAGVPETPPTVSIDSAPASPGSDSTPTWTFSISPSQQVAYECRLTRGATVIYDWATCSSPKTYDLSTQPDGDYTFEVRAVTLAGTGTPSSSTYTFQTAPDPLDRFELDPLSDQASGQPFSVTVRARTVSGAIDTSFNGTVDFSSGAGTVSPPTSNNFVNGVLTQTIRLTGAYAPGATLAATGTGGLSATSNAFLLHDYKYYFKQTTAQTGAGCAGAYAKRDMEEGYAGQDPEGTHRRYSGGAETINFCSPPFPAALPLGAGTARVRAWVDSTHGAPCDISATLMRNGTTPIGTATRTIPPFASLAQFTWTINYAATTVAAGDKLNLRFQMAPVKACSQTSIHYGGTVNRSHLELLAGTGTPTITAGPGASGSSRAPTWSFTGDAGATFECRLEDAAGAPLGGYDWTGCASAQGFDLTGFPDGGYTFAVRQTSGGITSPAARSDYVLDTATPSAPSIDAAPPTPSDDTTVSWDFSGEDDAALECRLLKGAVVVSAFASCSASQGYTLLDGDGLYTFQVRQRDGAGNVSAVAGSNYELDRTVRFEVEPVGEQTSGRPFAVTVRAKAADGTTNASFNGTVDLSSSAGTIAPVTSDPFVDGVLTQTATLTGSYDAGAKITATGAGATGTSAPFVLHDRVYHFKQTTAQTGSLCASANTRRDMAEGYAGQDPEETFTPEPTDAETISFCSPPLTTPEPLAEGASTIYAYVRNDGLLACDISASLLVNGTAALGSATRTAPGFSPVTLYAWTINRSATTVAAGAKLNVRFRYTIGPSCTKTHIHYGGTTRRSRLALFGGSVAPTITDGPGALNSDTTPAWSFKGKPGATFECRLSEGGAAALPGYDWAPCGSPREYDMTALPDGAYTFAVRQTVDTVTSPPATSDYGLDTTPPPAPNLDSSPPSPSGATAVSWSFSGEAGGSFECRLLKGAVVVSAFSSCSGSQGYTLVDGDGLYTFQVRQRDGAGNVSAVAGGNYELDTATPAAPTIDSPPASPGNDVTPSWDFSGEAGAAFECRIERGATVVADWALCSSPRSYDLSAELDGDYTFSVRQTDAAGNTSSTASDDYELDTAAPPAPTIGPDPGANGADDTPTWSFAGEGGASFECRLTRGATVVSDWAACSSPKSYDLSTEPDGAYTFAVRQTDAAGNAGAPQSHDYALDRGVPAAPSIDSEPSSPDNSTAPSWEFSGEATATFECRLARMDGSAVSDWSACGSPHTYSLSGEPDGAYSFSVRQTDTAGNTSPATVNWYVLDTTAGVEPSIDSRPASPGSDASPSWGFTGEGGATFECRLTRGATVVAGWAPCSSPKTYDLSTEPDATYTFSVRQTDTAGNTSSAASDDYRLDTATPAAPSIDAAPRSPGSDATVSWDFSGEDGAAFECRLLKGAVVVSGFASCSASRGYTLSDGDGAYSFEVRQTDLAGNVSAAAASAYELDTTPPAAPSIDSRPASPGSDASPSWGLTGEAGAAFDCRVARGATVVSEWAPCSSPKTYDLSTEPDATYTFSVRQTDTAGNTSSAASDDYQLDTAAPPAPSIGPDPGATGSDQTPSWGFTGEGGATFECRLTRGATVVAGWAPCSSPKTFDLSTEPDATYTFSVRQTDAAGNTGAPQSHDYTLDRGVPAAPSIDSAPSTPGSSRAPSWAFSGEAGATFECRLGRMDGTAVFDWGACLSPRAYSLATEPDGVYTFSVRQTDAAGNTSAQGDSSYVLDTTAGMAPSIDSSPSTPGRDASPSWGFSGEPGATFDCRLDRGLAVVSDWGGCSSPKGFDRSGGPDGAYTFSVRQTDAAGNVSPAATDEYELDTQAPDAPSIDPGPPSPGNDQSPSFDFSGEAGGSFECRLEDGAGQVVPSHDWAPCSSPRTYDLSGEPDGDYSFAVRQTDAAGGTGPAATRAYVLDTAAPAAPTLTEEPPMAGSATNPTWSFTGEAGAGFECRVEEGSRVSDWADCSSPHTHTLDLGPEPDGLYAFSVRAVDPAGNTGAETTGFYGLDRVAPEAPVITDTPGAVGNDPVPAWSFTVEDGAVPECRLERGADTVSDWQPCDSPETASYDLATEPDAAYRFLVRARDAAGNTNTGAPAQSDYVLDRTAPAAPTIDSTPGAVGSSQTPEWSFTGEPGAVHECRLTSEGGLVSDWTQCSSPASYDLAGAPDGSYVFAVRDRDEAGNTGAATDSAYRLDTTGADVTIESGPGPVGNAAAPSWAFSGEPGARFECALERDGSLVADWTACASPHRYDLSGQPDGAYTFHARSRDDADNVGPTASYAYSLDRVAPAAPTFTSSPGALGRNTTPRWGLAAEDAAVLECRALRDGSALSEWEPCAGGVSRDLSTTGDGPYALVARATDAAGNVSGASQSDYRLDATPPGAPKVTDGPGSSGRTRRVSWAFTGEPAAAFECRLGRGAAVLDPWGQCTSPTRFSLLESKLGGHVFRVRARDEAGNLGPSTSSDYELLAPREDEEPRPDDEPRDDKGDERPGSAPPTASGAPAGGAPVAPLAPPETFAEPDTRAAATPSTGDREADRRPPTPRETDRDRSRGGSGIPLDGGDEPPATKPSAPERPARDGESAGERLLDALGATAAWVGRNLDKTGFPLLLLLLVLGYVAFQNRLDSRDPKLALAPIHADMDLDFLPPPSPNVPFRPDPSPPLTT